jgi:hypothetical protein
MTDSALGPDYDPAQETLTDEHGKPITTNYLEELAAEAEAGYDLTKARQLDAAELAAMRTRGRPSPAAAGQSRAVSVRMNPELLNELHAAATARHVPVSTLIREATAQWLHQHAS